MSASRASTTRPRHDVLAWVDRHLRTLPSGSAILHPVAAYGHKATNAVVAVFFTLAATWYGVSERDRMIELLTALAPESKRAKARTTYLEIDRRLGAYTRVKFLLVGAIGLVLSAGFYAVGLSPLVTLVSVSVVGVLFGAFAVILAIPATSAVATLIDVLVLDHEPPTSPARRTHNKSRDLMPR